MIFFKINKPKTPSQRHAIKITNTFTKPLLKSKIVGFKNSSGRANTGKISIRHKGGGHKTRHRILNFKLCQTPREGIVCSIEYDPNRNAHIMSIFDTMLFEFFYTIAPREMKIGDIVKSGSKSLEPRVGYTLPLKEIPAGSFVHNITYQPFGQAKAARAAGTYAIIIEKSEKFATLKLNSGKTKKILLSCYATVGLVSNDAIFLTKLGKAGHSRWLNIRPTVRGVAMNPVDHPNGGGEGKKSGQKKSPWGKNC